jgi:four helix bundle protein
MRRGHEELQGPAGLGKAHKLTLAIYRDTRDFPKEERFDWTSQIRRSTASIAANLAEGCGRRSDSEMARFIQISTGSGAEPFLASVTSERPGFFEEHGIFQAKLQFRGSHENAIFAVAKGQKCLGGLEASG